MILSRLSRASFRTVLYSPSRSPAHGVLSRACPGGEVLVGWGVVDVLWGAGQVSLAVILRTMFLMQTVHHVDIAVKRVDDVLLL